MILSTQIGQNYSSLHSRTKPNNLNYKTPTKRYISTLSKNTRISFKCALSASFAAMIAATSAASINNTTSAQNAPVTGQSISCALSANTSHKKLQKQTNAPQTVK